MIKIDNISLTIEQAKNMVKDITRQLAEVEAKKTWPQLGDRIWWLKSDGVIETVPRLNLTP